MTGLKRPTYLHKDINHVFRSANNYKGEVGIEIEVEGLRLLPQPSKYWTPHRDGSLRGESMEYVFTKPLLRPQVRPALDLLYKELEDHGSKVKDTYRTSVHVHLNQQGRTMIQVFNHILLYMIVEDLLVEYSGVDRVGNLFCLRGQDAEYIFRALKDALKTSNFGLLADADHLRYAACNVTALSKFNSLEFRSFRGTIEPELIESWVAILLDVKDASEKFESPIDMVAQASGKGIDQFLQDTFNEFTCRVLFNMKDVQKRVKDGLRLVQDVAYSVDWSKPPEGVVGKNKEELLYTDVFEAGELGRLVRDGIHPQNNLRWANVAGAVPPEWNIQMAPPPAPEHRARPRNRVRVNPVGLEDL